MLTILLRSSQKASLISEVLIIDIGRHIPVT